MDSSVRHLSLINFRSYREASFEFAERTVLVGPNAAGKTNLLEALYLIASGKSFRADRENEMIFWGERSARVELALTRGGTAHQVAAQLVGGKRVQKTFLLDGKKRRSRDLATLAPMVLFSADDGRLIDGAPGRRRRALDLAISQSLPTYREALSRYGRALASRNRLLEQVAAGEAAANELDYWDEQLIDSGQTLVGGRQDFADFLNERLPGVYAAIADRADSPTDLTMAYQPLSRTLAEDVPGRRPQDVAVGTTTLGPHRDDWALLLGNRPLSSFGSGGEYRSAVLAFRLVETAWLETRLERRPTLLLDDVFSELDRHRRSSLLASLPEGQTIITTPEPEVLPRSFTKTAAVIPIGPEQARV